MPPHPWAACSKGGAASCTPILPCRSLTGLAGRPQAGMPSSLGLNRLASSSTVPFTRVGPLSRRRWRQHAALQTEPAPVSGTAAQRAPKAGNKAADEGVSRTFWPCRGGQVVRVLQQGSGDAHTVQVFVEGVTLTPGHPQPELHWGVYRSSPHAWQHPAAVVPKGSELDERSGAMRSAMQPTPGAPGCYTLTLTVPASLAPLSLAFIVALPPPPAEGSTRAGKAKYVSPLEGNHFTALLGMLPGRASPLGPSLVRPPPPGSKASKRKKGGKESADEATVNFAVRCRGGTHVSLLLIKPPLPGTNAEWGLIELVLDPVLNRTGDVCHVAVPGLRNLDRLCYGWRVDGDVSWDSGHRVQPDRSMLDPAAPALAYLPTSPPPPLPMPLLQLADGQHVVAASSLASLMPGYAVGSGAGVSPPLHRPLEALRVLEVDVKTFNPSGGFKTAQPGTFLAMAERADHFRAVGVNAVILAPCYATAKGAGALGRATVSFLAPDPTLSSNPADPTAAATELRAMVAALHAAGIEVLPSLDLAFTAEGTDEAPNTMSLRGLDHSAYFRANGVLNCGHPAVGEVVGAALRRWARDFGVDGFCFANAENMAQDADGVVVDAPALPAALCQDPVLSGLKLIAMPTDDALLPRLGARGFPHWALWQQRNSSFSRDIHAFLAEGTPGLLDSVAMRLTGSADIFARQWEEALPGNLAAGRRPAFGFNSPTSLARGPLMQVAREASGIACAAAMAAGSTAPLPTPLVVAKTLIAATVLAQGNPLLTQDATEEVELARFVGAMMRLRRRLAHVLLPPLFDSPRDITWHGAGGGDPDWAGAASGAHTSNFLAYSQRHTDGSAVYIAFNPHPLPVEAVLPPAPPGHTWLRAADTSLPAPHDASLGEFAPAEGATYGVGAKAAVVLVAGVVEKL